MAEATRRPVWAEVDLDAVRHNARSLKALAGPGTELCAVVKADAYGHGAVSVAGAALEGGATRLAVAVVEEGIELRESGLTAPVILLSEGSPEAMESAVEHEISPAVYSVRGIDSAERAAASVNRKVDVHLKVDTGMHRVGADPALVVDLAKAVLGSPHLRLASVWTHFAVAEGATDEDQSYTEEQMRVYERALAELAAAGIDVPVRHAANSGGTIAHPRSRYDMVRCGIALYGESPSPALEAVLAESGTHLRPVMSIKSKVTLVRDLPAGERPSYGRRRALPAESTVAVIPIGYADGVPRAWFERGGTVLLGGRRRPLAGTVTMDLTIIDCGPPAPSGKGVSVGDEVVLIGRQGDEVLSAADWARVLGTISYEILCGIGPRVPRVVIDRNAGGQAEMAPGSEVGVNASTDSSDSAESSAGGESVGTGVAR